jgi:hypothetical protein
MNKHLKRNLLSLLLLVSSTYAYAETEIIISRITLITDNYIIIDRDNEKNKRPTTVESSTGGKFNLSQSSKVTSVDGPVKYDLVTESNEHLSPYPLTEFWINKEKSDHNTFKAIGYTHEAEITIEDGTVRKIRTLDDYIL